MCWKKNRRQKKEEALFSYDNSCQRQFVRVRPIPSEAVFLTVGGEKVELLNISAGGLGFQGGSFDAGNIPDIIMRLPEERGTVSGRLEILAVDSQGVRHGRYEGLTREMVEAIHSFVLWVQKEQIRAGKGKRVPQEPPEK